jgi:hypothetical protein
MIEGQMDSRGSSRYEAVKSAIYLGWWEEPEFRTCAARLRNLSSGGALVSVAIAPPKGVSLWLCLAKSPPGEWVEVSPVGRTSVRDGHYELRLKFPESCPFELFEVAVLGHDESGGGSAG